MRPSSLLTVEQVSKTLDEIRAGPPTRAAASTTGHAAPTFRRITEDEIAFIEKVVRPMELSDE